MREPIYNPDDGNQDDSFSLMETEELNQTKEQLSDAIHMLEHVVASEGKISSQEVVEIQNFLRRIELE